MSVDFIDVVLLIRLCKKMESYIWDLAQNVMSNKYSIFSKGGTLSLLSVNIFFWRATILQLSSNGMFSSVLVFY
jgi:hypothetical protein